MSDERPINSKPFSSSSLIVTQKSKTISDTASLQVKDLSTTLPTIPNYKQPSTTSSVSSLIKNTTKTASTGTVQHSAIVTTKTLENISKVEESPNANNKQTEEIPTENQIKQYLTNLEPNILNDLNQATYHLKAFLANVEVIKNPDLSLDELVKKNPDIFSDDNIVIIAESGVNAGLYIDSFSVTDVVSIDPQFNSSGTTAKMVIKEPLGANFIDYYNGAVDDLGYETRIQAPIFVEISFRGYNENGDYAEVDSIGTKMYRMTLQNIVGEFKGQGAEYTIDLVVMADIARQVSNSSLTDNLTIQGKTVKDFFDKITSEWNKYQKDIEADESAPPEQTTGASNSPSGPKPQAPPPSTDNTKKPTPTEQNKFEIVINDKCVEYKDCMNWRVGTATNKTRKRSTDTDFNTKGDTIEATWAAGTDRFAILYDIIYSTKECQTLIVNGKKEGEIKPGSKDPSGISYLPEFDVGVEFLDYNKETHTYNKRITYYLMERQTTRIYSTPDELEKAMDNPEALKNQLAYVRRRYDYIGTGKNTEIIDLTIKIETNLLQNLPAYNAQKRVSVADNASTGTKEIQKVQVAGSKKAQDGTGVKPPTPIDPDKKKIAQDVTNGTQTTSNPIVKSEDKKTTLVGSSQTSNTASSSKTSLSLDQQSSAHSKAVLAAADKLDATQREWASLTLEQKKARDAEFAARFKAIKTEIEAAPPAPSASDVISSITASTNAQLGNIASKSKGLDSVTPNYSDPIPALPSYGTTGTRAYGANSTYLNKTPNTPTARNDNVTSGLKTFLEDGSRVKANTKKSDTDARPATVATTTQNRGGYNLDDSSGLGKSFVTSLLSQVYGGFGDMNTVNMEVRGDPLWLGVKNRAHTDKMGSMVLKDKNGSELPPSDQKILLAVVFPALYDERTGLATPDKISEGYTALYNVNTITSSFQGGKFTQTLELIQDLCTTQVRKYIDPLGGANI